MVLRAFSAFLLVVLLFGCSGVTTHVEISGCNNTIEILQDREGGGKVDVTPDVSWGNLGK